MAGRMRTRKSGLGGGGLLNGSTQTASRSMSFFAGRRTSDSLLALLLPLTLAYVLLCTLRCLASPENLELNAGSRRLALTRSMSKLSSNLQKGNILGCKTLTLLVLAGSDSDNFGAINLAAFPFLLTVMEALQPNW